MSLTPLQIKQLRKRAGLTQTEAATVVHVTMRAWQNWESSEDMNNHRVIPEAYVELFCLKTGTQYPPLK